MKDGFSKSTKGQKPNFADEETILSSKVHSSYSNQPFKVPKKNRSWLSVVGEPLREWNTVDKRDVLVQKTLQLQESALWKSLENYEKGVQSQYASLGIGKKGTAHANRTPADNNVASRKEAGLSRIVRKGVDWKFVGAPPAKDWNTVDKRDGLVQKTLQMKESALWKSLENYKNGFQSQYASFTCERKGVVAAPMTSADSAASREEAGPYRFVRKGIDWKLVGAPLTSHTRNTIEYQNHLVRSSLDEKDKRLVMKTILKKKDQSQKKGDRKKSVQFESPKASQVYHYPAHERSPSSQPQPSAVSRAGTSVVNTISNIPSNARRISGDFVDTLKSKDYVKKVCPCCKRESSSSSSSSD